MWFTFINISFSSLYFPFFHSIQTVWFLIYLDQSVNEYQYLWRLIVSLFSHSYGLKVQWCTDINSTLHTVVQHYEKLSCYRIVCVVFAPTKRRVPGRKRECRSTLSGNWKSNKGKKRLQLTSVLSTHPFVQKEAVWPKFILPHLPRRLFSLLGKHLEKCMKLEKEEYMWIYHILAGEE